MIVNPYSYGPPVSGETGFYDREDIFDFVNQTLASPGQNVMLLSGQRRIGKTSILHQIPRYLQSPHDYQVVFFDLQGEARDSSVPEMLYGLARAIARELELDRPDRALFLQAPEAFEDEFLPQVYERLGARRLLLTIDEFDVLARGRATPDEDIHPLVRYLDRIIQDSRHQRRIAFILTIGRTVKDVTSLLRVLRGATYKQVMFLPPDDAVRLIREPAQPVLTYADDDAVEHILALTGYRPAGGHPYYIQLLCHHVFSRVTRQGRAEITLDDVRAVLDEALESATGALSWFWEDASAVERFIQFTVSRRSDLNRGASLDQICAAKEESRIPVADVELKKTPDLLVDRQILRRDEEGCYRFAVELARQWIARTYSLREIAAEPYFVAGEQARVLLQTGRQAEEEGNLGEAIAIYKRARNAAPNYEEAYLRLGHALVRQGNLVEAIGEFVSANRFGGAEAREALIDTRLVYGRQLEDAGNVDEAIQEYEQILEIDSTHQETRQRVAQLYLDRGHECLREMGPGQAKLDYQKALKHWPECWAAIRSQVDDYRRMRQEEGKWPEAGQSQKVLIELREEDVELRRELMEIYLEQIRACLSEHDVEAALETARRALDDESLSELHFELAEKIKEQFSAYTDEREQYDEWEGAELAVRGLSELLPDDSEVRNRLIGALFGQGDFCRDSGRTPEALAAYKSAAQVIEKLGEPKASFLLKLAERFLSVHEIETAQERCQGALTESGSDSGIIDKVKTLFNGYCQDREGGNEWQRAEAAREALAALLQKEVDPKQSLAETRLMQAQFYLDGDDIEKAGAVSDRALKGLPDEPDLVMRVKGLFNRYRCTQEAAGFWTRAQKAAQTLSGLLPDDPDARRWLADTSVRHANFLLSEDRIEMARELGALALGYVEDVEAARVQVKQLFHRYGYMREKDGDWERAEQALRALSDLWPTELDSQVGLARLYERQGHAHLCNGDFGEAKQAYDRAIATWQVLRQNRPDDTAMPARLARTWVKLGQALLAASDISAAQDACRQALAILPGDLGAIEEIKGLFSRYRERQEAAARWAEAEEAALALVELLPESPNLRRRLADLRLRQGDAYQGAGRFEDAALSYERAVADYSRLVEMLPDDSGVRSQMGAVWAKLARVYKQIGQLDKARHAYTQAMEWQQAVG